MPSSIFSYSAVNVKAKALYGKLLDKADYEELASRRSVPEIAALLKKKEGYSELLSSLNEYEVHRGDLEKLLSTSLYDDYEKFSNFLSGKTRAFLREAFLKYEIQDIKTLLRVLATERSTQTVAESLIFLKNYSDLDYERLLRAKDIQELIQSLKGTQYYKALSHFIEKPEERILFDLEMALDLHFFMNILKSIKVMLSGSSQRSISKSFGVELDLLNIMWIYKCKKLFKLPKEVTLNHVIPSWYHLRREQLIQMAECRDAEEFRDIVAKTSYSDVFKSDRESMWETDIQNYLYRHYKLQFRRDFSNIGTMMAYIHLKAIDIKNIITLIEGVRYNLPREEINKLLIGSMG